MLTSKRLWLGVLISAAFLTLFLYGIDYPQTGDALKNANYSYVIPAIAVYFGSLWFRAWRWQYVLRHMAWIPVGRLYTVTMVGYMANNILPVRLGEVAMCYYLSLREKVSATSALATIGIKRIFDGLTLIILILAIWPFLPLGKLFRDDVGQIELHKVGIAAVAAIVFVTAILVFVTVAVRPDLGRRVVSVIAFFVPGRFKGLIRHFGELFLGGLGSLRSPKKLVVILLLSIPIWIVESLMYYLVSLSFHLDASFPLVMLVTATSNLVGALPAASGNIGTFEWAIKVTLVAFGHDTEAAVAYAATLHLILWLPVVIAGLLYLWTQHHSLAELARGRPQLGWADGNPVRSLPLEGEGEE